jgi:hypothetical protein
MRALCAVMQSTNRGGAAPQFIVYESSAMNAPQFSASGPTGVGVTVAWGLSESQPEPRLAYGAGLGDIVRGTRSCNEDRPHNLCPVAGHAAAARHGQTHVRHAAGTVPHKRSASFMGTLPCWCHGFSHARHARRPGCSRQEHRAALRMLSIPCFIHRFIAKEFIPARRR